MLLLRESPANLAWTSEFWIDTWPSSSTARFRQNTFGKLTETETEQESKSNVEYSTLNWLVWNFEDRQIFTFWEVDVQSINFTPEHLRQFLRIDAAGKTRSKTRTLERKKVEAAGSKAESLPFWTFDGSSTGQVTEWNPTQSSHITSLNRSIQFVLSSVAYHNV